MDNFLPPGVDLKNWKLSPLYAPDFSNLPPAIVSVGEYVLPLISRGLSLGSRD